MGSFKIQRLYCALRPRVPVCFSPFSQVMAVALEGRRQNGRRPNSNQYKKLTTNVEEAMPSLDKPGGGDKNFIY